MTGDPDGFTRWQRLGRASAARERGTQQPAQPGDSTAADDGTDSETAVIARPEPAGDAHTSRSDRDGAQHPPGPAVPPRLVDDPRLKKARQRGTQHLGLMVLRVGVGAVLVAHGLQNAFGWWGGPGIDGFEKSLAGLGFRHAAILAYTATGAQIAAGLLLILGLFTPAAAAGALAYLVNGLLADLVVQRRHGTLTFSLPDGVEYRGVLIVAVVAIILAGPGLYGFDAGRGWARRPFVGSSAALLAGVGAGVGVWVWLNGANPLA
ncbi:DoxX family protein [Mycobacterium sp.]|uniref:DoxX family protein n=1 Tax=Mycobacterium sp. TaxID=1785 RepID=UPI0031DA5C4F